MGLSHSSNFVRQRGFGVVRCHIPLETQQEFSHNVQRELALVLPHSCDVTGSGMLRTPLRTVDSKLPRCSRRLFSASATLVETSLFIIMSLLSETSFLRSVKHRVDLVGSSLKLLKSRHDLFRWLLLTTVFDALGEVQASKITFIKNFFHQKPISSETIFVRNHFSGLGL